MSAVESPVKSAAAQTVAGLVARARKAQAAIAGYSQAQLDELAVDEHLPVRH